MWKAAEVFGSGVFNSSHSVSVVSGLMRTFQVLLLFLMATAFLPDSGHLNTVILTLE